MGKKCREAGKCRYAETAHDAMLVAQFLPIAVEILADVHEKTDDHAETVAEVKRRVFASVSGGSQIAAKFLGPKGRTEDFAVAVSAVRLAAGRALKILFPAEGDEQ